VSQVAGGVSDGQAAGLDVLAGGGAVGADDDLADALQGAILFGKETGRSSDHACSWCLVFRFTISGIWVDRVSTPLWVAEVFQLAFRLPAHVTSRCAATSPQGCSRPTSREPRQGFRPWRRPTFWAA